MNNIFQKSQWIMANCASEEIIDKYFEYRMSFDAQVSTEAVMYISASTQYVVYINNQFVDCGQYEGYEDYQVYDTLDISKYLVDRQNELRIGHYVCGENFSTRRKLIPGIIFEVWSGEQILAYSDEKCASRANTHYLENREKMTPQFGFNFEYDANAADAEDNHLVARFQGYWNFYEWTPGMDGKIFWKDKGFEAKKVYDAEIERVWGRMLEAGADDFAFAGSLCHGWSVVPIYIWGRYFAQ